jgi:hypothetical protein
VTWLLSIFRSRRFWGFTGTALVLYLIVFVGLAHVTVPRSLSTERMAEAILNAWPRLPFFSVQHKTNADGQTETFYTVPTRQFTPAEIAQMKKPKPETPSGAAQ